VTRNRLLLWAFLAFCGFKGWQHWQQRAVQQPDGVLAADAPLQQPSRAAPFEYAGLRLTPRAHYRLQGRLLSRAHYHWGRYAALVPVDYAIGWGAMSDNRVLDALDFSHGNRFFRVSWPGQPPVPEGELFASISNNHVIPATDRVRDSLARMRPGQVVELVGELVDVDAPDGWHLRTSLTRADNGDGACEVFFVTRAEVVLRGK